MSPEVDPALCGVLHTEPCRKRLRPLNPDRIDRNRFPKIKNDPLRMMGIGFSREGFGKIGITLPEGGRITVIKSRVTIVIGLVECIAATWELVAVGEEDGVMWIRLGIGGPVTLGLFPITPRSFGIPVPCIDRQLRAKTYGNWPQARSQHLLHTLRREHPPTLPLPVSVDSSAKSLAGIKSSGRTLPDLDPTIQRSHLRLHEGRKN